MVAIDYGIISLYFMVVIGLSLWYQKRPNVLCNAMINPATLWNLFNSMIKDWRKIEQGPAMDDENDARKIHYTNQDGE